MADNLVTGNDGANTLQGTAGRDLIYGFDPNGPQSQVSSITLSLVTTVASPPIFLTTPARDLDRLFIVEKDGLIEVFDRTTGQVRATPFLDLTGQIATSGEQGLLGLAFHPEFASNGLFYINVTNGSGDSEIREYKVLAGDPNQADPASVRTLLTIDQPAGVNNHKGGWLGFGPDGLLYAAFGDGGGSGDPLETGQNIDDLLGNILRIDVNSDAFPGDPARNYAIPASNPFVGVPGADEIWAFGLRNPWRASFDRGLGDFFIGDVGQNKWEEIDFGVIGANYGWDVVEGPETFEGGTITGGSATAPIFAYEHFGGSRSVTGGYVYRGPAEGLQGEYFYAEFITGGFGSLHFNGSSWVNTDRNAQLAVQGGSVGNPASFGEDALGNLFVVDLDGDIFLLTPNTASADQGDDLSGDAGDDMIYGGSGNDILRGGEGADVLHGGNGNDHLIGGIGADLMAGSAGDDTYDVDNVGDLVAEQANEGTDTVNASLSFELRANVENLVLAAGAGALNGTGNGLANALTGNESNNILDGRGGTDRITGGNGADWFFIGATNQGGDLIADLSTLQGDRVVLSGAGFGLAATGTLQEAGIDFMHGLAPRTALPTILAGSNVYFDPDGTGTAAAVLLAQIGTAQFNALTTADFNGDGVDDLLWRDGNGATLAWLMAGGGIGAQTGLPSTAGYELVASGDFNANGTDDFIWKHTASGQTIEWLTSPGGGLSQQPVLPSTNGYSLVGTGDFNGDGAVDLVWKHAASGQTIAWLFSGNGGVGIQAALFSTNGYSVLATGDFDGNGTDDFLWREDDTGRTIEWLMSPAGGVGFQAALPSVAGYKLVATGDYDGNGTDDFLWRKLSDGLTVEWLTSPAGGVGFQAALTNVTGYDLVATGRFDGNATDDFIWKHTASGQTIEWLTSPTGGIGFQTALPNTDGYTAVATGHFNDVTDDIIWREAATGDTVEWLMATTAGVGFQAALLNAAGWSVLATGNFNGDSTTDIIWEQASNGATVEWLMSPSAGILSNPGLPGTGGVGVVHLTQDDFVVT